MLRRRGPVVRSESGHSLPSACRRVDRTVDQQRSQSIVCESALKQLGLAPVPHSMEETLGLRDSWRRIYARPLKRAHGVWHRGRYDWHVFSFKDTYALEGKAASTAYLGQRCSELIVLPNGDAECAARVRAASPPRLDGEQDVYVSPPDFSWTMVFTHEDGWCGPYFSRAEWVENPPLKAVPTAGQAKRRSRTGSRGR
jgi:hypothetical protein